jgi:hypothetical protein
MSDPIADPWCLSRFVEAQSDTYERTLAAQILGYPDQATLALLQNDDVP